MLFWFRWPKGKLGEFEVNMGLRFLLDRKKYHLIKNIILPTRESTTQIDQLIISPYGIFVIETKNMKGWIFGSSHSARWTQQIYRNKQRFQNPIRQNYKHVVTVQDLLKLDSGKIYNVVAFVGSCTFKTPMPNEVVHGVPALIRFIKSKREIQFVEGEIQEFLNAIDSARLSPGLRTSLSHIRNIKRDVSLCPRCGGEMVERVNKMTGDRFWGCKQYPQCKGTRPLS